MQQLVGLGSYGCRDLTADRCCETALFRNGILIREGPFRPFTDKDAQAFMKDLQDGYFPYELKCATLL